MKKILLLILVFTCFYSYSQDKTIIDISNADPGEVEFTGFELVEKAYLDIKGNVASFERFGQNLMFYGWILESQSRKVVWSSLKSFNDEYNDGSGKFTIEESIELPKGMYELYFASMYNELDFESENLSDIFIYIFKEFADERDRREFYGADRYGLSISVKNQSIKKKTGKEYLDGIMKNTIASIIRVGDNENEHERFHLKVPTTLFIYSLGERQNRTNYDFGWIINLETREKVWPNDETDMDHAGGGKKNYSIFQKTEFPAGDYEVRYVTDDSHSYDRWNVMPPFDPQSYGITIWTSKEERSNFSEVQKSYEPFLEITKVRNNEFIQKAFRLNKDRDIRILCIGEIDGHELFDYGWIVNLDTKETIWQFSRNRSEYAGGAYKNRMTNEVISMGKGNYGVYYITDGSHSYNSWNDSPPYDSKMWGISLWTTGEDDDSSIQIINIEDFEEENLITGITRIRNNEYRSEMFTLAKETTIRIYALGEGDDGRMYDTGWIKNMDSGRIVWEMTYRKSEHAGGADKNRKIAETITLPKGTYKVYYETDSSHSFSSWNDTPPHDQINYGIKIYRD